MQQNYKLSLQKLRKFNEWEKTQNRAKSIAGRLQEFLELFELASLLEVGVREREQARHLEDLIKMQRLIKRKGRRPGEDRHTVKIKD
jgi:hypothetical protein